MCAYSVITTAPVRAATLMCLVRSPCFSYANIAVFVLILLGMMLCWQRENPVLVEERLECFAVRNKWIL